MRYSSKSGHAGINSTITCPVCGKKFIVMNPREYTYKHSLSGNTTYYCSYTCWDHALLKHSSKDVGVSSKKRKEYLKDSVKRLDAKKKF